MNAAARLVNQGVLTRHLIITHFLTRQQMAVMFLAVVVLLSALSMIYITHTNRILNATFQRELQEQDLLHIEQGKLLLERSTWMMQARTQQIAEGKLEMVAPDSRSVIYVK